MLRLELLPIPEPYKANGWTLPERRPNPRPMPRQSKRDQPADCGTNLDMSHRFRRVPYPSKRSEPCAENGLPTKSYPMFECHVRSMRPRAARVKEIPIQWRDSRSAQSRGQATKKDTGEISCLGGGESRSPLQVIEIIPDAEFLPATRVHLPVADRDG